MGRIVKIGTAETTKTKGTAEKKRYPSFVVVSFVPAVSKKLFLIPHSSLSPLSALIVILQVLPWAKVGLVALTGEIFDVIGYLHAAALNDIVVDKLQYQVALIP